MPHSMHASEEPRAARDVFMVVGYRGKRRKVTPDAGSAGAGLTSLRGQLFGDDLAHEIAVGEPSQLRHHDLHDGTHVARALAAVRPKRFARSREFRRPSCLRRQIGQEISRSRALLIGQIGTAGLLELGQRVAALFDQPADDVQFVGVR